MTRTQNRPARLSGLRRRPAERGVWFPSRNGPHHAVIPLPADGRRPLRRCRPGTPTEGDNPVCGCNRRRRPPWPCPTLPRSSSPNQWSLPFLGGPAPRRHALPNARVNTFTRLADMTPGERTQKRSHSGGGHHRMGQHPPVEPARSRSTWSIWEPPTSIDDTNVSTLRPGRSLHPPDPPSAPSHPPNPPTPADPSTSPPPTNPRRLPAPHHRKPPHTGRYCAILHSQEVPPDSRPISITVYGYCPRSEALSASIHPPTPNIPSVDPGLAESDRGLVRMPSVRVLEAQAQQRQSQHP